MWSPDGASIFFAAPGGGVRRKRADDPGQGEILFPDVDGGPERAALDCSPDGRLLLYSETSPETKRDVWLLPLSGDRKPREFLHSEFDEGQGGAAFSPDGRWVAFLSDESGRDELYVVSVEGSGRRIVSTGGVAQQPPRWRRDGRELFYVATDNRLMSVKVRVGSNGLEPDPPVPLFRLGSNVGNGFDATADGQRFLVNPGTNLEYLPITVVLDWAGGKR